ncbi:mannose-1-phosphate guanylyltransferase [Oceanirhabdus sp. W0125-5]|uniref:mannose-1-phosphate guanylyltransferase n=1 Tax=Oceanirhabdus sp. W0125-5 TaxID=2999116 RepID=UPI0022F2D335|nr:mannose-1-phosphate guanylyltransferase [Oceanirhabdus sp. W0125-5]WBW98657.1 mannose-1-phosphate guanylyltransferase [Oceanirhabdus sp. W0125-5]
MLCALIMAGGKGSRLSPLSTEAKPKQFLKLFGDRTMIQMTVDRVLPLIPIEKVFVVTVKKYVSLVEEQLPDLPKENIIIEPYRKNTAPCIALSAFHINKKYPNATMAVLPADHLIKDEDEFLKVLKSADKFVCDKNEAIITVGMKPDRPETGYGYINFGNVVKLQDDHKVRKVEKFVEKPDLIKAKKYLIDRNYLWNSGMFIWKTINILKLTQKYLENTFEVLSVIAVTCENDYETVLQEKYDNVDAISVDYGIMEKVDSIFVIPGEFDWNDVGIEQVVGIS